MRLIITTFFGVEALTAREIEQLGYPREQITVANGQLVLEAGDHWPDIARAVACLNIHLATAERVLLEVAAFAASTFDDLFDQTRQLPWREWINDGFAFTVKGYSRQSKLFGVPAIQRLIKKAVVSRLLEQRGLRPDSQLPEDPALGLIRLHFSVVSDQVRLMIDTSGDGLHKRGYRPLRHQAPLRETLAAAMVMIATSHRQPDEVLLDPLCGSGTLPIEAALLASQTPPGLNRSFAAQRWPLVGPAPFQRCKEAARDQILPAKADQVRLLGSDWSLQAIQTAQDNAKRAGVVPWVRFIQADIRSLALDPLLKEAAAKRLLVLSNPPYGHRLESPEQAQAVHKLLIDRFLDQGRANPDTRFFVLTPLATFEQLAGGPADKRRKLYNGMIPCTLYQYYRQRRPQS